MALRLPQSPPISSLSPPSVATTSHPTVSFSFSFHPLLPPSLRLHTSSNCSNRRRKNRSSSLFAAGEDAELAVTSTPISTSTSTTEEEEEYVEEADPDPQDLEYVAQIKRVIQLLKENRDMLFSEVKLTIMIEDPRDVERRRLLGIDDSEAPSREELAEMLEEINEGKIPTDRIGLQMLYEEMIQWPNLEVKSEKKGRQKSLYAKATDTGVDPKEAAKRLNIEWDSAAEIEENAASQEDDVPKPVLVGVFGWRETRVFSRTNIYQGIFCEGKWFL